MPIRALLDGKNIIPPLDNEEWVNLQQRVRANKIQLRLPVCQCLAYPRVSPCGVQHFVHYKNSECEPESELHLLAKMEIVKTCRELGYEAIPEFIGDGWRADVLVQSPKWKCCFEVQVSPQSFQETIRRQEVYKNHNIRCYWLFITLPERQALKRDQLLFLSQYTTPMFQLQEGSLGDNSQLAIELNGIKRPLRQFVHDLINNKLRYSRSKAIKGVTAMVHLWRTFCPECGYTIYFFNVDDLRGRTECGAEISLGHNLYSLLYPEANKTFFDFYMSGLPPEICEFLHIETQEGMPFYEFICTGCGKTRIVEKPPSSAHLKSMTWLKFSTSQEAAVEISLNHWCDSPHCVSADPDSGGEIQDVLSTPDLSWKCIGIFEPHRAIDYKQRLPYRHYASYSLLDSSAPSSPHTRL
jgi:hypothetical protein